VIAKVKAKVKAKQIIRKVMVKRRLLLKQNNR
jgi:hypothetical protein